MNARLQANALAPRVARPHARALPGHFLTELLLLLAVATAGVALFERLRLPAIAGFLVMGALVGPGGVGLISDPDRVRALAELGVVFLLFEIGLELPVDRVRRMWRGALVGGGLQVVLTLSCVALVAIALGVDERRAVVLGALVAMSSTALVIRLLSQRGELDAPQGQLAMGVLLFQDLCVVPFLLAVPILAAGDSVSGMSIAIGVGQAGLALVVFYVVSRFLLPAILDYVARMESRELFTMVALLCVLGSAVIAEEIGLTLSVGAFVGGLVLATTPWAHQLFAEVVPMRGLLIGVFFTAVGMLFNWRVAVEQWPAIVAYTAVVIVLKAGFVALIVAKVLDQGPRLGVLTALALAQTGEFSFVLAASAFDAGLLDAATRQVFVAGSIATLLLTPFLVAASPRIAGWVAGPGGSDGAVDRDGEGGEHVVLVGFGLGGKNLGRILKARDIPYVAIDGNAVGVRQSLSRGEPVLYGDATRRAVLERAGIERATLVSVAVSDTIATREVVALAREMAPHAPIIARTRYVLDADALQVAGATRVVVEELEATLELVRQALQHFGVPDDSIARFASELRDEGYVFLRAPEEILDPWLVELLEGFTSHWIDVPPSFPEAASLMNLNVRVRTGATVVALERAGVASPTPDPTSALRPGDRILAIGTPEAIDRLRALVATPAAPGEG